MPSIGSLDVLVPSIDSFFYNTSALLKSDVFWQSKEFWTYKNGTWFILNRNEVSIGNYPEITYLVLKQKLKFMKFLFLN